MAESEQGGGPPRPTGPAATGHETGHQEQHVPQAPSGRADRQIETEYGALPRPQQRPGTDTLTPRVQSSDMEGRSPRRRLGPPAELPPADRRRAGPLSKWAQYDRGRLFQEEVQASSEASDRYLRESLGYAKRSLDAAHHSLVEHAGLSMPVSGEAEVRQAQIRETIRALASEADWHRLLRSAGLASDSCSHASGAGAGSLCRQTESRR